MTNGRILILPRTQAGRDLLRIILPVARWPGGELADGSSIYGVDFDEMAIEAERTNTEYDAWCREIDRDYEAYQQWCREQGIKK